MRNEFINFVKTPDWCPYTISEIVSKFSFDLNNSSGPVKYRCVHCNKEKILNVGSIRMDVKKGIFTSLCCKCRGEIQRQRKPTFKIKCVNDWVKKWLLDNKKTIKDIENNLNEGQLTFLNYGKGIFKAIKFKCIRCENYITTNSSTIATRIKNKTYTGLCIKCLSFVRCGPQKKSSNGYLLIQKSYIPEKDRWLFDWSKPIMEHRYVMAQKLQKKLLDTEIVHHKDGNKLNNNLSNLELWNISHPYGQKVEDKIKWAREILTTYKEEYPIECYGINIDRNPIKGVIFDMDGTIVDLVDFHYKWLNEALVNCGYNEISLDDHKIKFNGLTTKEKLKMLNISKNNIDRINKEKQDVTLKGLENLDLYDHNIYEIFNFLNNSGIKVAIATNSVRNTVNLIVKKMNLINLCDLIISNEDIKYPKPNPDIFLTISKQWGFLPNEILSIEDGHYGKEAALRAGVNLLPIKSKKDLTIDIIYNYIHKGAYMKPKWKSDTLTILIPMAGAGKRFEQAGYSFPKPLIDINGKAMIQVIVENLNIEANYVFIVQKQHYEKYNLSYLLELIAPKCNIVQVEGITEGAACTTLLAKDYINNSHELLISNSDQWVKWDSSDFMYSVQSEGIDGAIPVFNSSHPKWSYAKADDNGYVTEVKEKAPISNNATVGFYYYKKGSDYVRAAEQMISKNIRTNNEFYVAPVFNELIAEGKKIKIYQIDEMHGLGTPEDLNSFLTKGINI